MCDLLHCMRRAALSPTPNHRCLLQCPTPTTIQVAFLLHDGVVAHQRTFTRVVVVIIIIIIIVVIIIIVIIIIAINNIIICCCYISSSSSSSSTSAHTADASAVDLGTTPTRHCCCCT